MNEQRKQLEMMKNRKNGDFFTKKIDFFIINVTNWGYLVIGIPNLFVIIIALKN